MTTQTNAQKIGAYHPGSLVIIAVKFADFRAILGKNFSAAHRVRLATGHPVEFLTHRVLHILRLAGSHGSLYYYANIRGCEKDLMASRVSKPPKSVDNKFCGEIVL